MPCRTHSLAIAVSCLALITHVVESIPSTNAAEAVSFSQQVKPILAKRCFACHGPDTSEAGLALDNRESALAELDSGEHAIVASAPGESELLQRIQSTDESLRMPPEGKQLTTDEIEILRQWIAEGATWEKHWSFQPIRQPKPPKVADEAWIRNDVDRFVLSRLESRGLSPSLPATKAVLIRRLYYDLIGLPPSADEVNAFVTDDRPDAYERLVERLLNSPQYGEHWARHWLDVVRYAESNSYERDAPKPNVWKYRDYVIRSLNEDKPYDQFIREQLAGDQLDEVTVETMTATGYYRLGIYQDEPDDLLQVEADEMDDIVSTTGQAFLGLTVGCARCHDHKIDPFPQRDYFGLVAFMADLTRFGQRNDFSNSLWSAGLPEIKQQREQLKKRQKELLKQSTELEQLAIKRLDGELQRQTETVARKQVLEEHLPKVFTESEHEIYDALKLEAANVVAQLKALPPPNFVLAVAKTHSDPKPTLLHQRGNPHVPGDEVLPHFPEILDDPAAGLDSFDSERASTGRRRVLAEWIASADNPLTSRVLANRVWQHHFGRGIVRSPNNFGQLGIPPTHPELLDYLASYLIEHDWRIKPLHRFIVLSSTYRMSSIANEAALAVDPANDLFWRYDLRRLTAEQVRDSVLAVSGTLNPQLYGPSMYPELSQEVLATQSRPGENWGKSTPRERARRSIYIHAKRSLPVPLLTAFDLPDPDSSCEARFNTTQPAQAFSLLHGKFMHEQAGKLAKRVRNEVGEDVKAQISHVVRRVLSREPQAVEIREGLQLIDRLRGEHGQTAEEALRYYCLATLNLSEFLYLD